MGRPLPRPGLLLHSRPDPRHDPLTPRAFARRVWPEPEHPQGGPPCPTSSRSAPSAATRPPSPPPARRLGLPEPVRGIAALYSGRAEGLLVKLPGWRYPAVVDTATGTVRHDHFGGRWGDPAELGRFLQAYAVARATAVARRLGHASPSGPCPAARSW